MRKLVITTAAVLAAGIGLSGSAVSSVPAVAPSALLPLTDADRASSAESGCQLSFDQGHDTYLYMIGHDLLMRTAAGLQTCHVSEAQSQRFGMGPTSVSCGGRQLVLRRTGRTTSNQASDSSGGDATLFMTQGGRSRVVRGSWGVAC